MFIKNFDTIKPIKISFSQYSRYKYCPWKYFIEKIANIGLIDKNINLYFGSAFHDIIQKKFMDFSVSVDDLKNNFKITLFYLMHKDNFECSKEEYEQCLKQANNILDSIPFEAINAEYDVIDTEYDFLYDISPKKIFHGIIDFILKNKNTQRYLIGDWKTSLSGWNDYKINDDLLITQLQFYKYFWSKKKNIPQDQIDTEYWVVTRESNINFSRIPIIFKEKDIKLNIGDLKYSLQLIHHDHKFPKIKFRNPNRCKWCVYNDNQIFCDEDPYQTINIPEKGIEVSLKDIKKLLGEI